MQYQHLRAKHFSSTSAVYNSVYITSIPNSSINHQDFNHPSHRVSYLTSGILHLTHQFPISLPAQNGAGQSSEQSAYHGMLVCRTVTQLLRNDSIINTRAGYGSVPTGIGWDCMDWDICYSTTMSRQPPQTLQRRGR